MPIDWKWLPLFPPPLSAVILFFFLGFDCVIGKTFLVMLSGSWQNSICERELFFLYQIFTLQEDEVRPGTFYCVSNVLGSAHFGWNWKWRLFIIVWRSPVILWLVKVIISKFYWFDRGGEFFLWIKWKLRIFSIIGSFLRSLTA